MGARDDFLAIGRGSVARDKARFPHRRAVAVARTEMVEAAANVIDPVTLSEQADRQAARRPFDRAFFNALAAVRDHWRHGVCCEVPMRDLADVISEAAQ